MTGWFAFSSRVCPKASKIKVPYKLWNYQEPFFRAAMAAVPEAIEAIGLLATFGDKAGIDD